MAEVTFISVVLKCGYEAEIFVRMGEIYRRMGEIYVSIGQIFLSKSEI